ncbi:MAG TPA: Hint domain-containing protein [Alphaproteobacteria bacterium]|jgi:hypothetical protein|nr:Hint domain-containing protein [Alphaproteobacteria bacterium]
MTTDTITSTIAHSITLASGGTYGNPLTIAATGEIDGSGAALYLTAPWSIHNLGTITGGDGIAQKSGTGAMTVDNAGYIAGSTYGIFLFGGGSVTNESGGTIAGGYAIRARGTTDIHNDGVVKGTSGNYVLALIGPTTLTNASTGTIVGARDISAFAAFTLDNAGTIIGTTNNYTIRLRDGGSVTNEAGGVINSAGIAVGGYGAQLTIDNLGTIDSTGQIGVEVDAGGVVTNAAGATITGNLYGVDLRGANDTLENAGTIAATGTAGVAVQMGGSATNLLIVDAGAVFDGTVVATNSGATNTIELTSGASAGTLSGVGSEYIGFQTITIDAGATWDVAGTVAGFDGVTIQGFSSHDAIDLTDLAFDAGDTVTLDSGTDLLTIKDSGGDVLATIQLAGDFTGDLFHLSDDGHGHTLMTEEAPCYLKGTRIRTPRGRSAVEDLRIGDLVTTADGVALPLKWIGRRAYRDWLAIGNAEVQPILFKAGALADRVPVRDLYVSPEHAMFIDGVLVPAHRLVNGASIVKVDGMEEVEYFHLEFDRHVVIFAEDAVAESFVDDDSRMLFHNAEEYRRLYPGEAPRPAAFCAPRVEAGSALDALWRMLAARARLLRTGGKAAAVPPRGGYVDRATRTVIEGWAQDHAPATLAILVNGALVGETVADRRRDDLAASGLGDCGFRFELPAPLSPGLDHRIEVRRAADWSLLHGGARVLRPARSMTY